MEQVNWVLRGVLTILFPILFVSQINAQLKLSEPHNYSVINWDSFSGLESNIIRDIVKTDDGFLLIGSIDGLSTFDGYQFRTITNSEISASDHIFHLHKEKSGRIWILSDRGLIVNERGEYRTVIPLESASSVKFVEKSKNETFIILNGALYLMKSGKIELKEKLGKESSYYSAILYKKEVLIELNSNLIFTKEEQKENLENIPIDFLFSIDGDTLYYLQNQRMLAVIDGETIENQFCKFINSISYVGLKNRGSFSFAFDSENLWIIDEFGANKFERDAEFNPERINDIFRDDDNVYWVATETNGFYKIKRNSIQTINEEDGLENGLISVVLKEKEQLIVGYNCGGIEKVSDRIETLNYKGNGCVWTVEVDSRGNTWIGTYNGGVLKYNESGTKRVLNESTICKAIFEDSKGEIWFGTNKGLYVLRRNKMQKITPLESSPYCIYEGKNGVLLVGTSRGYYKIINDQIEFLTLGGGFDDDLDVFCFYEEKFGNYWIGTNHGLFYYRKNKYVRIPFEKFEIGEKIYSIHKDLKNNIWISGNKGLNVLNRAELLNFINGKSSQIHSSLFSKDEGLLASSFFGGAQNTMEIIDDNTIVYTSLNGLVFADLSRFNHAVKYPTTITEVRVDGKLTNPQKLRLKYGEFPIEINYTTPYFSHPEQLIFKYRINGGEWKHHGMERSLHLSNLNPGSYVIEIRSNHTSKSASLKIEILPLYYQELWFQILIVVLSICVISIIAVIIINRLRRKERNKLRLNEKIAELEVKAFQSKLNPHFVFNCLNSIQSLFLAGEDLKANKYMNNFSTLMRRILDSSDMIFTTIEDEKNTLELYLQLEKLQFSDGLDYHFIIDKDINPRSELIPANILQPFVENAIKHGVSGITGQGIINISFSIKEKNIHILISDNGIGYKASQELKKKSSLQRESKGMKIVEDRLDVLRSNYKMTIELKITEAQNPIDENLGTDVSIILNRIKK